MADGLDCIIRNLSETINKNENTQGFFAIKLQTEALYEAVTGKNYHEWK